MRRASAADSPSIGFCNESLIAAKYEGRFVGWFRQASLTIEDYQDKLK
jgi:hypothetical protein